MQRLLDSTIATLHNFVDQRDQVALILTTRVEDTLPITKVLEGLDGPHPSDLFWTYTDSFKDSTSYASSIVAAFATKHQLIRIEMETEGMTPWPDIPDEVLSDATDPAARLRNLAAFSRRLLPIPHGGNNVWIFYPLEIADHRSYAALIQKVLAHDFPNPWCHHLRFIVREDPIDPQLTRSLGKVPSVDCHVPDLGAAAVQKSLENEIDDESLPLDHRVSSLYLLGGIDLAHCRFQPALDKFSLVLKFYAPLKNYAMAAAALNSMGEVYMRLGEHDKANEAFQSALIPASQGENPPLQIFLNASMNLGSLRMTQSNWPQAAGYWDIVQQVAVATRDVSMKIRALDQMGYCFYRLQNFSEAEKRWHDGAVLADAAKEKDLHITLLERRRSLYIETKQASKEKEVAQQLDQLKR